MENNTGIMLITADHVSQPSMTGGPSTEAKCETLDSCLSRLYRYMQKVILRYGETLWANDGGMPVSAMDACKIVTKGYRTVKTGDYTFVFKREGEEPLSVVTVLFNPFYKV